MEEGQAAAAQGRTTGQEWVVRDRPGATQGIPRDRQDRDGGDVAGIAKSPMLVC